MVIVEYSTLPVEYVKWCEENIGYQREMWNSYWRAKPNSDNDTNDVMDMNYVFMFMNPADEVAFKLRFGL